MKPLIAGFAVVTLASIALAVVCGAPAGARQQQRLPLVTSVAVAAQTSAPDNLNAAPGLTVYEPALVLLHSQPQVLARREER